MLYVTTRASSDAFTAYRAMTADRAPDGGQFLPRQMPAFTESDWEEMTRASFNDNVARLLNLLCDCALTGRELDPVIGKGSARILDLDSRTLAAEIWRDGDCSFEETVRRIFRLVAKDTGDAPGQWFVMSLRIAMLFGIYAELMARGAVSPDRPLDLAVPSMDFQLPMAAWYARSWGAPIGTIICACNENDAPWSLIRLGELRTDLSVRRTITPGCDQALPDGLERLIHAALGEGEVRKYLELRKDGRLYALELPQQEALRAGLSVAVISRRRLEFMIPNLYRSGRWTPDLYAAMAYAALADHRASAGETGKALLLAEEDPAASADTLAGLLTIPADRLRRRLTKN